MKLGTDLTLWTIRFSLLCYVGALALRLRWPDRQGQRLARLTWTLGCFAYLVHVACAFHFFHAWSHAAAYEATARDTARLFAWDWGGGLYFNYAFTLLWIGDVVWLWFGMESYQKRPYWVEIGVQAFLAFMAFNGAIVFAAGLTRGIGIGACVFLAILWWRRRRGRATA
jgi:hypothetical protein